MSHVKINSSEATEPYFSPALLLQTIELLEVCYNYHVHEGKKLSDIQSDSNLKHNYLLTSQLLSEMYTTLPPFDDHSLSLNDELLAIKRVVLKLSTMTHILVGKDGFNLIETLETLSTNLRTQNGELLLVVANCLTMVSENQSMEVPQLPRLLRNCVIHCNDTTLINLHEIALCLAKSLKARSIDFVISTLYSLVNILGLGKAADRGTVLYDRLVPVDQVTISSFISIGQRNETQKEYLYVNVVETVADVTITLRNQKICEMAISLLAQKIGKVNHLVDVQIIDALGRIAPNCTEK